MSDFVWNTPRVKYWFASAVCSKGSKCLCISALNIDKVQSQLRQVLKGSTVYMLTLISVSQVLDGCQVLYC